MTVIAMKKEYKTSEAQRAAGKRYRERHAKPGYKSHEQRRAERRQKENRKASDRLAKDIVLAAECAFGVRACRSCGEQLPMDGEHFAPQQGALNNFAPRCRACVAGFDSWSARVQHRADTATERQERNDCEQALGLRDCSACNETLPLDDKHFYRHAPSRLGFTARCKACMNGHSSWSSQNEEKAQRRALRDTERAARAQARAEVEALKKAQRAKLAAIKGSDEWKAARSTKHKALEMMPLYSALAFTAWQAWDYDWSVEEFAEALQGLAFNHNRESFLELNSNGYLAATEGRFEDADPYEMARTWEELEVRWQEKLKAALDAMDAMLASVER